MQIRSIRFKTTLLYSGILLAILIVYNAVIFFSVRSILLKDIDEGLTIKAGEISNILHAYEKIKSSAAHPLSILEGMLQDHGIAPSREVIVDELWKSNFETLKLKEDYILILRDTGQVLMHSNNATTKVHKLMADQLGFSKDKAYFANVRGASLNLRAVNMPFLYKHNLPLTIQVATPLNHTDSFLNKLMAVSSACLLVIVALTSFLGNFFVRKILAPVVAVTKTAEKISHQDLSTRISSKAADVEMKQLITSFNAMIERLEKSFTHINEFNSYVAHELKTPLAIVKGELELAVEQSSSEDDCKILRDCLEETDRMIKITKDLLLLTKLDYQPQILKFEKIDFSRFFKEIVEHATILASEKKIKVSSEAVVDPVAVSGDKVHLRRLFLNIVSNAIKYTSPQGAIHLSARKDQGRLRVEVRDTGEGIGPENLNKIFDKFFRVDKGEKSHEAGFGLGLSIAQSIAKAHRGDIQVSSRLGEGTTFSIFLPLVE